MKKNKVYSEKEARRFMIDQKKKIMNEVTGEAEIEAFYVLIEKFGFSMRQVERFAREVDDIGVTMTHDESKYSDVFAWEMKNGYLLPLSKKPENKKIITDSVIKATLKGIKIDAKNHTYMFFIHILRTKFRFSKAKLNLFRDEIDYLVEAIQGKYLSYNDVLACLNEK